jgi:genome maintenance exonuclease 1
MHSHLEHWLAHGVVENKSNLVHQQSALMATRIIEEYLSPSLNEWWGSEVGLYYPELYAGTTDLVGVYDGVPSIIDFKQTNKPKKTEWIEDYFLQASAYAAAHNAVHGTDIKQGVILMCSKDCIAQNWVVDLTDYEGKWFDKVWQYYSNT